MTEDDALLKARLFDQSAACAEEVIRVLAAGIPMDESRRTLLAKALQLTWHEGYAAALAAAEEKP